jgi:hypothetical protein
MKTTCRSALSAWGLAAIIRTVCCFLLASSQGLIFKYPMRFPHVYERVERPQLIRALDVAYRKASVFCRGFLLRDRVTEISRRFQAAASVHDFLKKMPM